AELFDDLLVLSTETRRSAKLISLFLRHAPIELGGLQAAIGGADRDKLKEVAHRFKGSCRAVGALRTAELWQHIERSPVAEAGPKYNRLAIEFERARVLLEAEASNAEPK